MIPILVSGILIFLLVLFLIGAGTPKTRRVTYSIHDVEDQLVRIRRKIDEVEKGLKE